MNRIGILTPAEFLPFAHFEQTDKVLPETDFGSPEGDVLQGVLQGREVLILPRNGNGGTVPPHRINYRANVKALGLLGATSILGLVPVNGIRTDMSPGMIVLPDQLIDYTFGRASTFFDEDIHAAKHIDFRQPYDEVLREHLLSCANNLDITIRDEAIYGIMQGPRLATLAEINRLERDGCAIVGMSGMPEAILAKELSIPYVCIGLVTHKAAGRRASVRYAQEELGPVLKQGLNQVHQLVEQAFLN